MPLLLQADFMTLDDRTTVARDEMLLKAPTRDDNAARDAINCLCINRECCRWPVAGGTMVGGWGNEITCRIYYYFLFFSNVS